ncbi:MAG: hypothetical protein ICV61_14175 [Microcoleus sp. Co-bin12]|nr:hypothetical protein [Microcoleus sp. Co-bin12]
MTYFVSRNTPSTGAVMIDASLLASCSGTIERIQNSDTTHSIKRSSTPDYNSIFSHSPQNTTVDRGFSAPTFEAIGGAA